MQIQLRLLRNRDGIAINVQAAPIVESFFREMVPGSEPVDVGLIGRYWSSLQEGQPLQAYQLNPDVAKCEGTIPSTGVTWTLSQVGGPLFTGAAKGRITLDDPPPASSINLSMLRLKGISQPGGITFRYHGIIGEDQLEDLTKNLHLAAAQLYNSYLRDFNVTLRVMKED